MSLEFYRHNENLGIDEYKLSASNAKMNIFKSTIDKDALNIVLITDPANKRNFCFDLANSFDQIVGMFDCTKIILRVGNAKMRMLTITKEDAKIPEKILQDYKKNCSAFWRATA